jgi:shikimate dehydrogenase
MTMISNKTRLYCIFGNPVGHSLSPAMHNAAFRHLNIDAVYLAFQPDSIEGAVRAMRALPIMGASVTIPFKRVVMDFIDEIDPLASDIGSVNTLTNAGGKIRGCNTDGFGALESLKENGIGITGSVVLILGNGGSARSIAFTLLTQGSSVIIAGRDPERIAGLSNDLRKKHEKVSHIPISGLSPDSMRGIDVIINTTPIGMEPDTDKSPINENLLMKNHTVFDIVYKPEITTLLKAAASAGCRVINGSGMLLHQGAKQFEIWTGSRAPIDIMRKAIEVN